MRVALCGLLVIALTAGCAGSRMARMEAAAVVRAINVGNGAELQAALADAQPGDLIQMADGVYPGSYAATASGTAGAPIQLVGSRAAVIDGGSIERGYGFHLRADHWVLRGFTIRNAKKGLMADTARSNIIDGLQVMHIGEEAIHLRTFSTGNTIQNCTISDTGVLRPGFGEGVYLGSAKNHWATYTAGAPDTSDGNRVLNNHFGPNVRAEAIDIKEGTTGGEIRGNVFDGTGMSGENAADSWIDLKGNGYLIVGNRGVSTLRDGFQTHIVVVGWGRDNIFRGNSADVGGDGYGIRIQRDGKNDAGNVVYADNTATRASQGVANILLTPTPRTPS